MVGDCSTEVKQHTREARGSLWLTEDYVGFAQPGLQCLNRITRKGNSTYSFWRARCKDQTSQFLWKERWKVTVATYWILRRFLLVLLLRRVCTAAPVMHYQTRQTSRPSTWVPLSSSFFSTRCVSDWKTDRVRHLVHTIRTCNSWQALDPKTRHTMLSLALFRQSVPHSSKQLT